ncbi:MAG: hypothetical protein ACKV0T_11820 [Planctomycetales bacterium]
MSRRPKLVAIVLATVLSAAFIFAWRRLVDPLGFIGAVPTTLEVPALGVSALVTSLLGTIMAYAASRSSRAYPLRWGILVLLLLAMAGGIWALTARLGQPSIAWRLQHLLQMETQLDSSGRLERQDLSFWLAAFGRGAEARAFSTRFESPYGGRDELPADDLPEPEPPLTVDSVPWAQAIQEIAARERIVIIMEAHHVTEHREWIEQTLPLFRREGFSHYAVEALAESGDALKKRGFPVESTGFYLADPRFGNLLRSAIALDFSIHDYETPLAVDPAQREEQQARALARIVAAHPGCKILIHAGFAHAFKQPIPGFGPCMAARLWEQTGIEPYCIYQGSAEFDAPQYPQWVVRCGATEEPRMLIPPPRGLKDPQFTDIPAGAIDALVIHPLPNGRPPGARQPRFSSGMTRVSGRWLEPNWPIVVGAYRTGESIEAIALDQVLLRDGESEFELWIPSPPFELRVTSATGRIAIDIEMNRSELEIRGVAKNQD